MTTKKTVSIVGASGYTGGEMLRLLADHPQVQIGQIISRTYAGQPVTRVHPHLRGVEMPTFVEPDALTACDILVLAMPHGQAMRDIEKYAALAEYIVDLSADFRLRSPQAFLQWYGEAHGAPDWLEKFAYGLPESNRAAISTSKYVSGVGCNATATNLALLPLVRSGLLMTERPIIAEVKAGSSEGGATANPGTHHPVRSNVVRSYAPVGHRHTAEIQQVLGVSDVHLSLTSLDIVRGALATAHAFVQPGVTEKDLWKAYRAVVKPEPFLRIVKEQHGLYRRPEPKLLAGTNFADISFDLDSNTGRVVAVCAIDNLVKGAAGSAVQCMNLMLGWEETSGLGFRGLHPI